MAYLVPAVLGGLAITVVALVSLASSRRAKKQATAPEQPQLPKILVHSINDDRCTGCDACVAVCPTNVLDLVDNKSRVLRFQDCIQCEACMWACPTEALVMHPEGTEPPPIKQPDLDTFYQTAVPGQYLIGEVSGKPLVKNGANLGRAVVEHMLQSGLTPGHRPPIQAAAAVDVAIVGAGPAGLSAALTCLHHGLSYVVLEKEHMLASTIARYPKGKLIMAEPYDSANVSFLPVFDSSKEETLPIWQELVERVGMSINMGEPVEAVQKQQDGSFAVRSAQATYAAQRVVLATGLRGKPRTLGVPGENLPKVHSLLEDPDDHRGQAVCVVGGGDSALEAAIALADAGAKVVLSYRGRSFARAAPKNKKTVESYAAQRRIKVKYQSEVAEFGEDTITLRMSDGTHKRYPNQAAFVLIGADPPIKWLKTLGIEYVENPHMAAAPKPDDLVRQLAPERARDCPENAAGAAAFVQGRDVAEVLEERPAEAASRPRKWLRSATKIFTGAGKLEKPMPLSEFAKQNRKRHSGDGRRDDLEPGERTRILRMLRDEGARVADEDSKVYRVHEAEGRVAEASPPGAAAPPHEPPVPLPQPPAPASLPPQQPGAPPMDPIRTLDQEETNARAMPQVGERPKQAVIVGLARAAAEGPRSRRKRRSSAQRAPAQDFPGEQRPPGKPGWVNAPTRAMTPDDDANVRRAGPPRPAPPPDPRFPVESHDESTHLANFDPRQLMAEAEAAAGWSEGEGEEPTRQLDLNGHEPRVFSDRVDLQGQEPPGGGAPVYASETPDESTRAVDLQRFATESEEDATRAVDLGGLAHLEEQSHGGRQDTREQDPTRAIDLEREGPRARSLSDIDFDLD